MNHSPSFPAVQSHCAGCGQPGSIPTISTGQVDPTALGVVFVDDIPRFMCQACRADRAEQRRREREARP